MKSPLHEVQADIRKLVQLVIDSSNYLPDQIAPVQERKAKRFLLKYRIKKRLQPKFKTIKN